MNIGQAKRLKKAGFPQEHVMGHYYLFIKEGRRPIHCNQQTGEVSVHKCGDCYSCEDIVFFDDEITNKLFAPTEKELMEYLKPHLIMIYPSTGQSIQYSEYSLKDKWGISLKNDKFIFNSDLTEALVQACEAVGGGK